MSGSLLVGQSGGPTAVINASLAGVAQAGLASSGVDRVLAMVGGVNGAMQEQIVDLGQEAPEALELLRATPAAALGSCRHKLVEGDLERLLEVLKRYDVRYFHYIGGNDSADTAHRVDQMARHAGYELHVVSVPKTIDNDLPETDHCPGYGSTARFIAQSTREAGLDTRCMRSTDPVKIIEVMGRNSGWVAAAAALAREREEDAPHLIYFPEDLLDERRVLDDVQACCRSYGCCVLALCENQRGTDGEMLGFDPREERLDSFGHRYGAMPARYLCLRIREELGLRARFDHPGTLQRVSMAVASEVDLDEAYRAGQAAVRAALAGSTDIIVTLVRASQEPYRCEMATAPLEAVANTERSLPDEFINAERNHVAPAFLEYARPLIGCPLPPVARLALRRAQPSGERRISP